MFVLGLLHTNWQMTKNWSEFNTVFTINHPPYSSDLAPCNFYLFSKLYLRMRGKHCDDIEASQKALTAILKVISLDKLKNLFDILIYHSNRCIDCKHYFRKFPFSLRPYIKSFMRISVTLLSHKSNTDFLKPIILLTAFGTMLS